LPAGRVGRRLQQNLWWFGRGKRLFGTDAAPAAFQLVTSKVSPNGAVIATYTRAGEVKTGSFALEQPTLAEIERRRNMK
jgi:hypothetical protein